jgi:hypothetical protein
LYGDRESACCDIASIISGCSGHLKNDQDDDSKQERASCWFPYRGG